MLQWYGYAADGAGFHCLEMDEAMLAASVAEQENAITVIINNVDPRSSLSVQLLTKDLKNLVDANWDWQVKWINDSDFMVIFQIWRASLSTRTWEASRSPSARFQLCSWSQGLIQRHLLP
jgi:hypothetical protein